jgi:myosin heavy subunit
MKQGRTRARRKQPSEKQKPFFDKQTGQAMFFGGSNAIQPKLNISKASDPMEKEADAAARKVNTEQVQKAEKKEEEPVQKAEKKEEEKPVQKAEKKEEEKPVQKAEKKEEEKPVQKAEKKEEEKPVQKAEKKEEEKPVQKAEKKEEEKPVQAKLDPQVQTMGNMEDKEDNAQPSFESLLSQRKGLGFALPDDFRVEMEDKFHSNFKNVRIHTDPEAAAMCEEIHALAFAYGHDIYFNEGMYNPNSPAGKELLAHELAHVVQQNG